MFSIQTQNTFFFPFVLFFPILTTPTENTFFFPQSYFFFPLFDDDDDLNLVSVKIKIKPPVHQWSLLASKQKIKAMVKLQKTADVVCGAVQNEQSRCTMSWQARLREASSSNLVNGTVSSGHAAYPTRRGGGKRTRFTSLCTMTGTAKEIRISCQNFGLRLHPFKSPSY